MQQDEIELIAVLCRLELQRLGVELRIVQDLSEVVRLFGKLGKSLSKANDPERLLLTQRNSFSVFGFEDGEPVMGFMVRIDDLGDEDAQSFLPRSIETIFGVKVLRAHCTPYAGRKWGRAAYFGDLKAKKRKGIGPTGRRVLELAIAYAHYRAFEHFDASLNYCFLRGVDVRNGVPYGFLEADPYVWETDRDLYPDGSPVWVMQLSRRRLPSLMAAVSLLLPDRFAIDQKPRFKVVGENSASGA